jgi:hypothetical protein
MWSNPVVISRHGDELFQFGNALQLACWHCYTVDHLAGWNRWSGASYDDVSADGV